MNRVIAGRADYGNVDTTAVQESLGVQPEENYERELVDIYKALGCEEKNEDVPEELTKIISH